MNERVEFTPDVSHQLVALSQDAVLDLKDFLPEHALAALGLGDFALDLRLPRQVGSFVRLVAQFPEALLDILEKKWARSFVNTIFRTESTPFEPSIAPVTVDH